ncbi:hypothetical protein [Rubellicoccus peritrichatus]|uniref:Outer membrane lipoprotein-sorting protein n=1 Tax=Rubellicoccus peritrichatus TaxID=3080537 RepID=A0AAQ3QW77_9BACT|nr:hypothetical protein [Puniceicoccus sp. CR14]WOO41612.1 hypothetical protein RZN69_00830 [Puniceicoccus sp. CR14]
MFTNPRPNPIRVALIVSLAILTLTGTLTAQTITVREVIRGYLKAQGGEDRLEKVQSIKIEGTVTQGEANYRLLQFKKLPNLVRLNISGENKNFSMGYNGKTAWIKPSKAPQSIPMEAEAAETFIANATLFSQLYTLRDRQDSINLLGESTVKGEPCYELQVKTLEGSEMIYFLGKNDFLERKVSQFVKSENGVIRNESFFSDFREVPPLTIPFLIESYSEGELSSIVKIKAAKLNAGVFNSYFNPPGGLTSLDELKEQGTSTEPNITNQRERSIGLNLAPQEEETPILSSEPIRLLQEDEDTEFDISP